jgi:cold-inducible RNA-binding protein
MATKLFVGSLSWNVTSEMLEEFFATIGAVASATVINDRDSGRSKGFGFVEFENDDDAKKAIDELNGKELDGRPITVNEARPREERPRGNFGGGDRGGNRGGGYQGGGGGRQY